MRVIGGDARGRVLRAPRGLQTRPTSDLLRGAIFSMLAAMGIRPRLVLDLYAGTGALGIEALSRGAEHVDFVERSRAACDAIHDNLDRAGYRDRATVIAAPVERSLGRLAGSYDLVFLDPPYAERSVSELFALPAAQTLLTEDAVVVYEHSRREPAPPALGGRELLRTRSHGSSSVSFYQRPERQEGE